MFVTAAFESLETVSFNKEHSEGLGPEAIRMVQLRAGIALVITGTR